MMNNSVITGNYSEFNDIDSDKLESQLSSIMNQSDVWITKEISVKALQKYFLTTISNVQKNIEKSRALEKIIEKANSDDIEIRRNLLAVKNEGDEMNKEIIWTKNDIQRSNKETSELEDTAEKKRNEIADMVKENEKLQEKISFGPGWTPIQEKERDNLTEQLQKEKSELISKQDELENLQKHLEKIEIEIKNIENNRDTMSSKLSTVNEKIESCAEEKSSELRRKESIENDKCSLEIQLKESKEQLQQKQITEQQVNDDLVIHEFNMKKIEKELEDQKNENGEIIRKYKVISRDVQNQKELNRKLVVENEERKNILIQTRVNVKKSSTDIAKIQKQTEILVKKHESLEQHRAKIQNEHDEIKLKSDSVEHVQITVARKEGEMIKRRNDSLKREAELLLQKRDLSEKNLNIVTDLVNVNESKLKSLKQEVNSRDCFLHSQNQAITDLSKKQKAEEEYIFSASDKYNVAIEQLKAYQEVFIETQKKEIDWKKRLKEGKDACELFKDGCIVLSKEIIQDKQGIDRAAKQFNTMKHQINTAKEETMKLEKCVDREQKLRAETNQEIIKLRTSIESMSYRLSNLDDTLKTKSKYIHQVSNLIRTRDQEKCDLKRKHHSIMVQRDILGAQLVQKNNDLEQIVMKLRTQRSELQYGEVEYNETILRIAKLMICLQKLQQEKKSVLGEKEAAERLYTKQKMLENECQRGKSRNDALQKELHYPINFHRWRTLEHSDSAKYAQIMKIQKLQRQLIELGDSKADIEKKIEEKQRTYCEIKKHINSQPSIHQIETHLNKYKTSMREKKFEISKIELELETQVRRVEELKKIFIELDQEKRCIYTDWLNSKAPQPQ